jgi:hypothetical protein
MNARRGPGGGASRTPVAPATMEGMEPKIIACDVLRDEVEKVAAGRFEIEFVDALLHDYPDKMRVTYNERIAATPGERTILLGCGRCSNGTVGLKAGPHRLVLPAVDDCIAILLGSRATYLDEFHRCPGTYYYTRGWIDYLDDPYKEYLKMIPKWGEERAARVARLILAHYKRFALIDTGTYNMDDFREYLATVTAFYGLPLEVLPGSFRLLEKLLGGPHDEEFIVVEPGNELEESSFWALSAGAGG